MRKIKIKSLLATTFILSCIFLFAGCQGKEPEIKYGEFPFRLEYELAGETIIVEDTAVCKFDGFEQWGEAGKYRKWKTYLKSGKERLTLLKVDNMEFYFSYGTAQFYMGDNDYKEPENMNYNPNVIDYMVWENGRERGSSMLAAEAWEKYQLRIIDWQYSPPIQNSFK